MPDGQSALFILPVGVSTGTVLPRASQTVPPGDKTSDYSQVASLYSQKSPTEMENI